MFWPRLAIGIGLLDLFRLICQHAKHIRLTNGFGFRVLIGRLQGIGQRVHQRSTMRPQAVERPGHNQLFQNPTIKLFDIGSRTQVEQLAEITALVTRFDNSFDGTFAHALNRANAVNNFPVVIHVEVILTRVNIRRQDFEPHAPALIDQTDHLFGVVHIGGHYRGHKLGRVVRFQPQRLVGDQRIGCGVRLVKPVSGKFLYQIEDFHRQFAINAVFLCPFFEGTALLGHLFRLFLTHCTAQHIRAAKGVTGEFLGDLHDLFLVQDDAIGRFQYRLQAFVLPLNIRIGDLFPPVLTVDKVVHHPRLQRARTEQGHQGDHIFEAVRLQTFNQIFHAAGFKLEYRRGFRALQHVEAFLVIQRDRRDINRLQALFGAARVDHLQRPIDDGKRTQAKEVELHQTGIFHIVLVELGDRMRPGFVAVQRREIGNFRWRDHHPTGVFTGVTGDPFQLARHVDQRFNFFVCFVDFRQLRLSLKGFRQRHARIGRHQLGNAIHKAVRMTQHAAHIANNRFRRHRTEGNNLRYRVAAVHLGHVIDNLVAFLHAEVDVEVGH
ncbi:hypothetical protein D3C75_246620 [compost metagenome]